MNLLSSIERNAASMVSMAIDVVCDVGKLLGG